MRVFLMSVTVQCLFIDIENLNLFLHSSSTSRTVPFMFYPFASLRIV